MILMCSRHFCEICYHPHLMPRLRVLEVHLHSSTCFHTIVLNYVMEHRENITVSVLVCYVQDAFQFGLTTIQTDVHSLHISVL
jgi:hypothetical protein